MKASSRSFLYTSLAAVLALSWTVAEPVPAWAQDDEEGEAGEQETAEEGGQTAPAEPAAPAAEEPASPIPGWFRFDLDAFGPQFWFGATHKVGSIALASDVYLYGTFAELDLGVALTFGNLVLTPMVGVEFDFATYDVSSLIAPQLFTTYIKDKWYFDSWIQVFFDSPFVDDTQDLFYFRAFLVYKLFENFGVGPQVEVSYLINESVDGAGDDGLSSLPIGAQFNVGYGKNSTLGIFLGYDTQYEGDNTGIAGRFTFIQTW